MSARINGSISKKELCVKYGFSRAHLSRLLNKRYFNQLKAVGYEKSDQLLAPNVVRKFVEIYGSPITDTDFIDGLQPSKTAE